MKGLYRDSIYPTSSFMDVKIYFSSSQILFIVEYTSLLTKGFRFTTLRKPLVSEDVEYKVMHILKVNVFDNKL